MYGAVISDLATSFTRINKQRARALFTEGKAFYVIAHKMRPGYPFSMGLTIFPESYTSDGRDFDWMVSNFAWYNCSHETGYYPAFYLEEEVN